MCSCLLVWNPIPGVTCKLFACILNNFSLVIIKFFFGFLCAVISELIHYSAAGNSSGLPVHMPLIQVIVPQVMNLKAQLRDSSKVLLSQILHLSFLHF